MTSVCRLLEEAADENSEKPLFVFPQTRWNDHEELTYGALVSRSASAKSVITQFANRGDRALLLFPAGAAFWEAFVGCLASGVIAVPLKTPNFNRVNDQLADICRHCAPSVLLTDQKTAAALQQRIHLHPEISRLPTVTPEQWRGETAGFEYLTPRPDVVAFLQYTSGSTASPKGIQISHDNLLANMAMIRDRMGIRTREDRAVTWLPHYHDMGLVGSYLTALFTRITSYCLPPEEFAIRPASLLQQISDHKAGICGGPDFMYRLCVEKIDEEQMASIDLSSWRVAYVGAERIRATTLRKFSAKFATSGFRQTSYFPCYGLGEATLIATGGPPNRDPIVRTLSNAGLMQNQVRPPLSLGDSTELVGSGQTFEPTNVLILDTETGLPLVDEQIGEVMLSGPSVTRGYFRRQDLNDHLFRELPWNGKNEIFLHTGDLGFLSSGELFITGRIKEVMIVRGKNLSPEDIEQQIGDVHEALMPGGSVVFSIEKYGEECVVVAAELKRTSVRMKQPEAVIAAIRVRVVQSFGVNPADILLLNPASIPRTSSGKLKRLAVRDQYLNGTVEFLVRECLQSPS